jgi:hypothetical protein
MALPKKKSRPITVNGEDFRYVVSTGKYDDNWDFNLNITIQIAHGKGNILKIEGLVTRDFWLDFPNDVSSKDSYPVLTPKDISILIINGIKAGWHPNEKGTPFTIKLDNSFATKHAIN